MVIDKIVRRAGTRIVGGSLPDIDCDFETQNRARVKKYIEGRFGSSQMCSVGTYTTLKLKGAIKDLARQYDTDFKEVNLVTACIDAEDKTVADLFRRAAIEPKLKKFIEKCPQVFYELPLVLNQPKARSIHACATIAFPNERTSWQWTPMIRIKGEMVSQMEGGELDSSGFLKNDILGVEQWSKISSILGRVRANGKEVPDIYNLPLDEADVYRFASNGWTADVFQLNTPGLTRYSRQLKPDNINDIIACIALWRPSSIQNGFPEQYIRRKTGEEDVSYPFGTENSLRDTFGLCLYQENLIQICSDVAGFDLVTADAIRSAAGKKIKEKMDLYGGQFVEGSVANGCSESEAVAIWEMLEKFAGYGFNLSHSVAYGLLGYVCLYLKVKFLTESYAEAISRANEKTLPYILNEIGEVGDVKVSPPDINKSDAKIVENGKELIWGLSSIKQCGDKSVNQIIESKRENGKYKSFTNFLEREIKKGSKVNKSVVENLVLSGAFDSLENIKYPEQRLRLIETYREGVKTKVDESKDFVTSLHSIEDVNLELIQKQRLLSGLGYIDYDELAVFSSRKYIRNEQLLDEQMKTLHGVVGGIVTEMTISKTSKGDEYCKLILDTNYKVNKVTLWNEQWLECKDELKDAKGRVVFLEVNVLYNEKFGSPNQIVSEGNAKVFNKKLAS